MRALLGDTITATIPTPAGNPADLSARIEVPGTRVVVVAGQPAQQVEFDFTDEDGWPRTGAHTTVELDSPAAAGEYLICWQAASTGYESFEPLLVS